MNQLHQETSPYLLQHAHNPVHWYAWKEEAFERARREDKPILVSIGYSTCHWCHVMERESFENEEIAAFMNEHFVNIKVDREERPDVDQIYMEACQAISGSGGWPLNCFLTPDKQPFYAGTYFPPRPAHQRPSWMQMLQNIHRAYTQQRAEVEDQAKRLTEAINRSGSFHIDNDLIATDREQLFHRVLVDNIFFAMEKNFDREEGGFGSAPKFPGTMTIRWLLRYAHHTGQAAAREQALLSLDKMCRGGIYDQIGGGFARYATDRAWLIPHFEKMLYDNALLVGALSDAYQLTQKSLYRETIEETLDYLGREMSHPDGGFYSALDADSEGVEGKFYVWSRAEVVEVLGTAAAVFCDFYDITETGNWEGHNILQRQRSFAEFATAHDLEEEALRDLLREGREKLLARRAERVRPGLDDKQLLSWNALMVTAYAQAYRALGREADRQTSRQSLDWILRTFRGEGDQDYYHTYKEGRAQYEAFLADYAFLIEALLEVHRISYDNRYLEKARQICDAVIANFTEADEPLFYYTAARQQDIPVRRTEVYDSALPSANSTMVSNLRRLALLLDRSDYGDRAERMLKGMKNSIERYPTSFARWGWSVLDVVFPPAEVAVLGTEAIRFADAIQRRYLPGAVVMGSEKENEQFPLLRGKPIGELTYIYLCRQYACQQPVNSPEAFEQLIAEEGS
ncbi:MAG: thioredoxin domain-containing protein [Bacteroidota bacterium]